MQVGSICRRDVVMIDADRPVRDAAVLMRRHHVGTLAVTTEHTAGPMVLGIVTDRDLVMDVMAADHPDPDLRIGDLAHTDMALIDERASLFEAVVMMGERGVRRLLVRDGEHRFVGIVSLDDLIQSYAPQFNGLAQVIRQGLQRELDAEPVSTRKAFLPNMTVPGAAPWGQTRP